MVGGKKELGKLSGSNIHGSGSKEAEWPQLVDLGHTIILCHGNHHHWIFELVISCLRRYRAKLDVRPFLYSSVLRLKHHLFLLHQFAHYSNVQHTSMYQFQLKGGQIILSRALNKGMKLPQYPNRRLCICKVNNSIERDKKVMSRKQKGLDAYTYEIKVLPLWGPKCSDRLRPDLDIHDISHDSTTHRPMCVHHSSTPATAY